MNDPQRHDIHLGVLLHGFGVFLGAGLVSALLAGIVLEGFGLKALVENPGLILVPVSLAVITMIVVGYAVGASAYHEEVPVNLQVFTLGALLLLLHFAIYSSLYDRMLLSEKTALFLYWRLVMFFTIPIMLIGARWALRRETARKPVKSWLADDAAPGDSTP